MSLGLVGRKRGMSRIFTEDGVSIPVTVIEVDPNRVTQLKTVETDGYRAVQVTAGTRHRNRIKKTEAGLFAKANVEAGRGLWEFRLNEHEGEDLVAGNEINVNHFAQGQIVDVAGTSIGKGYAGTIKRHNFSMGDATHGNSLSHRSAGSIGQCQDPGKVFKGKKMAGHLGNVRKTIQNLEIVKIDEARNLLLIRGAVPGAKNGDVIVSPAVKARG